MVRTPVDLRLQLIFEIVSIILIEVIILIVATHLVQQVRRDATLILAGQLLGKLLDAAVALVASDAAFGSIFQIVGRTILDLI